MVDTKPVTDRIAMVDADGRLTAYGIDILKGFERAIGGPGSVNISNSMVTLPVLNELARFDADGNLESTGMVADTDLTLPADLSAVDGDFSGVMTAADVEYPGKLQRFRATVDQSDLASAGTVTILSAAAAEQWRVTEILLSGTGTNFSGGDRLLDIKQGATVFTTVTAALLQTLVTTRWGGTDLPLPSNPDTATAAAEDIVAQYSGGATDYTAGLCTIFLTAEKL